MSFTIDGYDLTALGVVLEKAPAWRDLPTYRRQTVPLPGRIGELDLSPNARPGPRMVELVGTQSAANAPALLVALDSLKRRLNREVSEFILPDRPDRTFVGKLDALRVEGLAPDFAQRAHRLQISIRCDDPRLYSTDKTVVNIGAVAAETEIGTAPVGPVIRLNNPNDPVLTYRTSAGTVRTTMALTVSGVSWIEIDCERMTIVDSDTTDRPEVLTGGDFITLDPADGSVDGADGPTLAVSGATGTATYRKAWW